MHEDAPACVKSILDKLDTFGEGLEQIFVVHIVNLYDFVREAFEQVLVQRQSQDGEDVCDASGLERFFAA